jgi:hypothetical protein
MIDEDQPKRDSAEKVEPQIAFGGDRQSHSAARLIAVGGKFQSCLHGWDTLGVLPIVRTIIGLAG